MSLIIPDHHQTEISQAVTGTYSLVVNTSDRRQNHQPSASHRKTYHWHRRLLPATRSVSAVVAMTLAPHRFLLCPAHRLVVSLLFHASVNEDQPPTTIALFPSWCGTHNLQVKPTNFYMERLTPYRPFNSMVLPSSVHMSEPANIESNSVSKVSNIINHNISIRRQWWNKWGNVIGK